MAMTAAVKDAIVSVTKGSQRRKSSLLRCGGACVSVVRSS